jgi:hypothetical protein
MREEGNGWNEDGRKEREEKRLATGRGGPSVYEWFLEARGNLSIRIDKS